MSRSKTSFAATAPERPTRTNATPRSPSRTNAAARSSGTRIETAAILLLCALALLVLFEPGLDYRVSPPQLPLDSPDFVRLLGVVSNSGVRRAASTSIASTSRQGVS